MFYEHYNRSVLSYRYEFQKYFVLRGSVSLFTCITLKILIDIDEIYCDDCDD